MIVTNWTKTALGAAVVCGLVGTGATAAMAAPVFSGNAVGSWGNLQGSLGSSGDVTNGDNGATADLEWGNPVAGSTTNRWRFDGVGSDGGAGWSSAAGTPFKVGDFSYRNGAVSGHSFTGADLFVDLNITSPDSITNTFTFGFDVTNTPNTTGDPVLDGDIVTINSAFSDVNFSYDGQIYTLALLGFSEDAGQTITTGFNSPENTDAAAGLYGSITAPPPVPLPAAAWFMLTAIGGLFGSRWLKKGQSA